MSAPLNMVDFASKVMRDMTSQGSPAVKCATCKDTGKVTVERNIGGNGYADYDAECIEACPVCEARADEAAAEKVFGGVRAQHAEDTFGRPLRAAGAA